MRRVNIIDPATNKQRVGALDTTNTIHLSDGTKVEAVVSEGELHTRDAEGELIPVTVFEGTSQVNELPK